ncbi:MAG TPA: DUF2293 domain-containing protein [Planctomycetota bacterium]|nr:DUF2293 domain-containing protein [Planctomycetota bacterium]
MTPPVRPRRPRYAPPPLPPAAPDVEGPAAVRLEAPLACAACVVEAPEGAFVRMAPGGALCLRCAGFGGLAFLPSGDPALTRRASASAPLAVVALRFNRRRKRFERVGTLLAAAALESARAACAADAEVREARRARDAVRREVADAAYVAAFAAAVRARYPGAPAGAPETIARHACEKASGRVGRTADAKRLDPEKVDLAVVAHVRHAHTGYDALLDARVADKREARDLIRSTVRRTLDAWRAAP